MTATPADIQHFTNNGALITLSTPSIVATHINAVDLSANELEMFFDNAADAQTMLTQRFTLLSLVGRIHDGIQVEDTLELGTSVPVTPVSPRFLIVDVERGINALACIRSYAFDMATDSYAVEVAGVP